MSEHGQWLALDMNGDGQLTISDVGAWLVHLFFLPGHTMLSFVRTHLPELAAFFELGPPADGGPLPAVLSGLTWFLVFVFAVKAAEGLRRLDRALTDSIVRLWLGLVRHARILRIRTLSFVAMYRPRKVTPSLMLVDPIELDELEAAVLRCHSAAQPFEVLTARAIAEALARPRRRVQSALERLRQLSLVESGFGTDEGESAYRITQAGQIYLIDRE